MNQMRLYNRSLPQMLNTAQLLLYLNAALDLLFRFGGAFGLLLVAGEAIGAFGLANERKWGYWLALVAASLPVLITIMYFGYLSYFSAIVTLLVRGVVVVFLIHPTSRSYKSVYFT